MGKGGIHLAARIADGRGNANGIYAQAPCGLPADRTGPQAPVECEASPMRAPGAGRMVGVTRVSHADPSRRESR
jgi:hypothetical protein